jgi:hypothetical protein
MTRRDLILSAAMDCATNFLYYDRKEDEDLGVGEIDMAVRNGELSIADIADAFAKVLGEHFND